MNCAFNSFKVWYSYQYEQEVLDSMTIKKMTGLQLSWFLQSSNGSNISDTETYEADETDETDGFVDWTDLANEAPSYVIPSLVNMVDIASA